MNIEQIIVDAVSISKETKIPVLFFSNPGFGKTTILKRYANHNNLHLETLIGSRFSPEEISGYQVNNGGDHLQHLNPEWFNRIWEKKNQGISTLLFIDELSTCSESVQGALLSLIFDRTIGSEKFLPEDCLIVSAANYSGNVSSYMNILSPTLNRFMIINLNENYTALDLLNEFLDSPETPVYPEKSKNLDPGNLELFNHFYKDFWFTTFIKYSDTESSIGIIDISNTKLNDIYADSEKNVYNFISGRTLSFLRDSLKAYIELDLKNPDLLLKMINGLVGGGSYSFKDSQQITKYQNYLFKGLEKITKLKRAKKITMEKLSGDISKDVSNFLINKENLNTSAAEDIVIATDLVDEIKKQFELSNVIESSQTTNGISKFIANYESVLELQQYISKFPDSQNLIHPLTIICTDFYGLYCDTLGIKPDFQDTFGLKSRFFTRACFLKFENQEKNPTIKKGGLRFSNSNTLPCFYEILPGDSFFEAGLQKIIHNSDNFKVLIFDEEFKFVSIEKFLKSFSKKMAA